MFAIITNGNGPTSSNKQTLLVNTKADGISAGPIQKMGCDKPGKPDTKLLYKEKIT